MKKLITLLLSGAMLMSMAACGGAAPASSAPASSAPASSAPASSEAASSEAAASEAAPEGGIQSAADLEGKKIGVQAGTTGEYYVTDNIPTAELMSFKSGIDAALDLKNGSVDAVVLDELPAKAIVAQNPDLYIVDFELTTEEYAIAVKKGNTALLEQINKTIADMRADGRYELLVNAFMPAEGPDAIQIPVAIETTGDVIKMGTNAAFSPFEYVDGTEIVGFDVTMSQYIAQTMGRTLQIENMEFDSLLSALDAGVIDFVAAGMTATEERKQNVDFSEPYFQSKQVVILKK